jgi:UDP-N-acetylmuramoyl-L-alanyl-D-glutamate--2,6-diaminopimelate ligase
VKLRLKIPGDYNLENALAALSVAFILGIDKTVARETLEKFDGIPGRMEEVKNQRGIKIFIDFAHTPNGLEQALKALNNSHGRLIAVIGAEGKRDVAKRTMLGEVAKKFADIIIVTAVDPRGELDIINKAISEGALKAGAKQNVNLFVIADRQKAIEFAVNNAKKGDVVGIFGKGHEQSMNLDGKTEIPWSEKKIVNQVING